jgi:hypothetical protein
MLRLPEFSLQSFPLTEAQIPNFTGGVVSPATVSLPAREAAPLPQPKELLPEPTIDERYDGGWGQQSAASRLEKVEQRKEGPLERPAPPETASPPEELFIHLRAGNLAIHALTDLQAREPNPRVYGPFLPSGAVMIDRSENPAYARTMRSLIIMGVGVCAEDNETIERLVDHPHTIVLGTPEGVESKGAGGLYTAYFKL